MRVRLTRDYDSSHAGVDADCSVLLRGHALPVSVPAVNWKEVRPFVEMPHFRKEIIERKNQAAAGLCAWVNNIVIYHDILVRAHAVHFCAHARLRACQPSRLCGFVQEEVGPKREALAEANVKLAAATEKLAMVEQKLASLEVRVLCGVHNRLCIGVHYSVVCTCALLPSHRKNWRR